jgi:hypothetical protein
MPDYHFSSHSCRFPNQPAPVNGRAKEGIVRYPQSQPSGGWVEDFNPPGNYTNPDAHYGKRVRAKGLQVEKEKKQIYQMMLTRY